ncbi:hypothetical protein MWLf4_0839 [Limosilactobacillus fermentum]|nr:hypothetical protein MWLf4_0839 [Limosilactobacillus fermentum]
MKTSLVTCQSQPTYYLVESFFIYEQKGNQWNLPLKTDH